MSSDSADTTNRAVKFKLETVLRSDALHDLREMLLTVPVFQPLLEGLIQIRLIIDANIIQGELRWRLASRRKPDARSALHEAIVAGVVVPFAPVFLRAEIEEHIGEIAVETGATLTRALEEWHELATHVHFYEPQALVEPNAGVVDVNDLPYKHAYDELAAVGVYSRDHHFQQMNVPVINVSLDLTLRKHARSTSVLIHVTMGSTVSAAITFGAVKTLLEVAKNGAQAFRRLPTAVQVSVAALALGLMIHKRSREKIMGFFRSLGQRAIRLKPILFPVLVDVAEQFFAAVAEATETRKQIESALPSTRKRSAVMHARAICLMSKEPLSVAEIGRRMRIDGYLTRSATFSAYLRRLLRNSKQFVEASPGKWRLMQAEP